MLSQIPEQGEARGAPFREAAGKTQTWQIICPWLRHQWPHISKGVFLKEDCVIPGISIQWLVSEAIYECTKYMHYVWTFLYLFHISVHSSIISLLFVCLPSPQAVWHAAVNISLENWVNLSTWPTPPHRCCYIVVPSTPV